MRTVQTTNPAYKHGHAGKNNFSPEYHSWAGMLTRCYNPNRVSYKYYGGKGIKVCKRWHKFENFLVDMGPRPKNKTLDRKRGDKNYSLRNCRWATRKEQSENRPKKPHTGAYSKAIVEIVSILPTALPELYEMLQLHPEVIKKEVRELRQAGIIKTTYIPWGKQWRTLLREINRRY